MTLPPLRLFRLWILGLLGLLGLIMPLSACQMLATPAPTPVPLPTATPFPINLAAQREVMRPDFVYEVDSVANTRASNYELDVTLVPESLSTDGNPYLLGLLQVHYTNTEAVLLNQIYFRLFPNTPSYGGTMRISQVMVNQQAVDPILLTQNSTLGVPLFDALEPGESIDIQISYEAVLPTQVNPGFGIYTYYDDVLALAGFFPIIPVFDVAGWHVDDPAPAYGDATYTDIAFFEVRLTTPAEMLVASTGHLREKTLNEDGTQTHHFFSGPTRDFQVVMSNNYQQVSQTLDGITVNSYYPAGADERGQFALDVTVAALQSFNQRFGPYPYKEFDVVSAPINLNAGGVEYPGLIIIAQRYYFENNSFMEFIIAHEVAHQWWYGLVGNDQVNEPWLDEALTNYSAIHYYEDRYGPQAREQMVGQMFRVPYRQLELANANQPVAGAVQDFSEPLYGAVVYGKGPLFFEALRNYLGDEAYFDSLHAYARQYRYGLASGADFVRLVETHSGQSIQALYAEWITRE